jgi:hypothetical protein
MSKQSEEEARLDGYIRGSVITLYHALRFAGHKLTEKEMADIVVGLIPQKLNGQDRRAEYGAHLRVCIQNDLENDDPERRVFARRLFHAIAARLPGLSGFREN